MTNNPTKMEIEKLLPCPFCGCERVGMEVSAGGPAGREASYCVRCHQCFSASAGYGSHEIAANHWNSRVKVDHQPVELPRIQELEIFIEQMYETLKAGKIRDFDTNWRMTEEVLPPSLECIHAKDAAEISGSYRKIHLSDILAAARELINLHWKRQPKREIIE